MRKTTLALALGAAVAFLAPAAFSQHPGPAEKPAVLAAHGRVCGNPASRIIKYIDLHIKPMLLTKTDIVNDKN